MMLRKLLLITCLTAIMAGGALAQDDEVTSGLNNPRNLFLAEDGTLFIAEAGSGGSQDVDGPFGPAKAGLTGQISAVNGSGEFAVALPELVSMDAGFGQVEGVTSLVVTEDSFWVVLGMGPADMTAYPDKQVEALVQIDRATGDLVQVIDLRAFEAENNPDGAEEIISNPADIAVDADGKVYIADASANAVLTWTEADGLMLFAAWSGSDGAAQAVPTSVAIDAATGAVFIGFLSGFPFEPGSARIERYAADGTLEFTYEGLTLVTDLIVSDGVLYAVELAGGYGDQGYIPDSGRIVSVTPDGLTPIAEGLNFPYGAALDADGSFLVTVDSAFGAANSGRVIRVAGGM